MNIVSLFKFSAWVFACYLTLIALYYFELSWLVLLIFSFATWQWAKDALNA